MEFLKVARMLSSFGLKGEIKIYITSTNLDLRFKKNNFLYIDDELKTKLIIEKFTYKKDNIGIIKFDSINTKDDADKIIKHDLLVEKDNSLLPKNQYFYCDLIGLTCYDENNNEIGKIESILEATLPINLNIKTKNKVINIPFNDFFIKEIDLDSKKIIIHLIEGLIDEN